MDQEIRNKLRNVVTQCRRLLEDSISQELEGKYGIFARKDQVTADPNAKMTHLSEEEQAARRDILDHFAHIKARGFKPKDALDQLVREIAFTHLNRLCAYKMMEAREVYVGGQKFREAVSRGVNSNGVKFYLADHPNDLRLFETGQQDVAYRHFLDWLGKALSDEIGVLFNPNDPANRLYPKQKTLDEVLDLLNDGGIKAEETELRKQWPLIWSQDETIGWVYQYFTPKELRDKARKESQAPRNSYELAFRNQFFTPRYVVEFLTDNTLGRIWYEMRKGDTKLKDQCRYMVRRPDEVFLSGMATKGHEHVAEGCGEALRLLTEADEATFSAFSAADWDNIQRMIDLAHCVSAYETKQEGLDRWYFQVNERIRRGDLSEFSTQDLLDHLFYTCRGDRHGGDGSVYRERWFIDAANEIRRRVLSSRDENASQEELLKAPVFIPHRPKKDPRELKILDPACGSGHFLLYCFDLLLTIYEEAYADPDLGPALQKDYPKLEDLRRDVPRLILAHNLHGIDIDLRASQIAALALWLRCQRAYQDMGFKKDRPKITRSNFVCAEPMPGEEQMLKEFVSQLEPKVLGQVVEVVFDKMKLAGEAGSLLKIEEEIRDAVAAAKKQYVRETTQATDRKGRPLLFTQAAMDRLVGKPEQPSLFDLSDITDDQFFEQAEARVIEALRSYAEKAHNGQRLQRRLFTEDAVRGFAFVDVCQKRYDVVLMNPPFGDPSHISRKQLESRYTHLSNEIAVAFVQRSKELLTNTGYGGILSPRNPLFLDSLSAFRREFFLGHTPLQVMADAGFGVLDEAMIETAVLVYSAGGIANTTWVARLLDVTPAEKAEQLLRQVGSTQQVYLCRTESLRAIPNGAFAYWATPHLLRVLEAAPPLESLAQGKWGLFTADNDRFLRLWWEIAPKSGWVPYYKGGAFRRFIYDAETVVNWTDGGVEIKQNVDRQGRQRSRIPNSDFYFKKGLTFPNVTFKGLAVRAFPEGSIFSLRGPAVFANDDADLYWLLGFLNSRAAEVFVTLQAATRRWELAQVMRIPVPPLSSDDKHTLARLAKDICLELRGGRGWDETSRYFREFPSVCGCGSLAEFAEALGYKQAELQNKENTALDEIERIAERAYGLGPMDIECVRTFTGEAGNSTDNEDTDEDATDEFAVDVAAVARRMLSFGVGCLMGRWGNESQFLNKETFDPFAHLPDGLITPASAEAHPRAVSYGIVPDDADNSEDVLLRLRGVLEVIWKDRSDAIEVETCEVLGVKELRDYFRKPGKGGFWDDHISRYSKSRRKAPIYWLLQSSKKNYALWLYYHRLDKDLLFKALVNYVEPKIRLETSRLESLRAQKAAAGGSGKEAKRLAKDVERQEDFLSELRDFEDKLRRAANLHLEPDLNDGVVLNIAPLHELVPWKEAKKYWNELLEGKYEWSSIGKQLREKGLVE